MRLDVEVLHNSFAINHLSMRLRGVVEQVRRPRNLIIAAGIAVLAAFAIVSFLLRHRPLTELTGVVLQQDKDPAKQPPVKGAEIFLSDGLSQGSAWSDSAGLFHLKLRPGVRIGESATLVVRHPDYISARILEILQDRLYVSDWFRRLLMSVIRRS